MKRLTVTPAGILALTGILTAAMSMPALAGPNWFVIHEGEAHHFARHQVEHVVPLDYGPRAITTPWLNKVHEDAIQTALAATRRARAHMVAANTAKPRKTAHN